MSGTVWHFGHLKIWFFKGHESLESKASCFLCLTLRRLKTWKCDFFFFLRPSPQGYVATGGRILDILVAWKCVFWRVVRPWAQGYRASSESLYSVLATGKCYYSRFIYPRPIGIYHPQSLCSAFWRPEMMFFKGHETIRWRILDFW
jgi:hypothetical protein